MLAYLTIMDVKMSLQNTKQTTVVGGFNPFEKKCQLESFPQAGGDI